jgi:integrase
VVRDAVSPGLAIRRQGEGVVSFVVLWEQGGKPHRATLGRYPDLSLADAREIARKHPRGGTARAATVNDLLDLYEAGLGKVQVPIKALLKKHVRPAIGDKKLATLHRRDVQGMVDKIEPPSVAGQVGRYIAAALNFGERRGHVDVAIKRLSLPKGNDPRERVLGDAELTLLLKDWCPNGPDAIARSAFGSIFALCLLTGARRSEISELSWDEIGNGVIHLSAERSKGNRPTQVVLSSWAQRILAAVPKRDLSVAFPVERPRTKPGAPDARPGRSGRGTVSGFSRATADCQARTGTADWSPHDLRRTCATNLAIAAVPPHVIDAMLNHATVKNHRTYAVHNRTAEVAAALEVWGEKVWALAGWSLP